MISLKNNNIKVIINWRKTDTTNKVRLIKWQGIYLWQVKQKVNDKWILTNQLFENFMSDRPQQKKSQIIKMINRGMAPKTIVYIINKIHEQGLCKKGMKLHNVYKIARPLRKKRYAKIEISE